MIQAALVRSTKYLVKVYGTADPRSLAAGRIALALVLLLDLVNRCEVLRDFYTNDGLLPNHTVLWRPTYRWVFSVFHLASWSHEATILFVVCGLAYLALLFGWHTRLAQVASFVAVLSLHGRTNFIMDGGDIAMSDLALWTMFLPTGRRYSIDALPNGVPQVTSRETRSVTSLAVAALTLQLGFIYLFNAVQKNGATWRDGTAVHYVLHQSGSVTAFGVWAREHLPFRLLRGMTKATRFLEWTLAGLLLLPIKTSHTRRATIICMWVLHLGFAVFLNLGAFVPTMLAYTPNLATSHEWDSLERWRARVCRPGRPSDQGATLLSRLTRWLSSRGCRFARSESRVLKALHEAIIAATMAVAGIELLAANEFARRRWHLEEGRFVQAAVSYLQLFQPWWMFAPEAPTTDINLYVDAVTQRGRHVDPFNEVANPRYPAPGPHIPARLEQNAFFCYYIRQIVGRPDYHQAFTEWILRYPERTGHWEDEIISFEAFIVQQTSPHPGEREPRDLRTTSFLVWPPR